jgi:uncharacterized membrane protein YbhN (UPF0104 family)
VDRAQDVVGLGLLAGAGALLAPRALSEESGRVLSAFVMIMAVAGVAGLLTLRFFPARAVPFRVRRLMVRVRQALRATASRPQALVLALMLGVGLQLALIAINRELGHLIGIDLPFYVWLFAWSLAKIAGLTPLTQGGIGVREAALAALLAPFGVPAVKAVAAGLVFQAVVITGGLLSGLLSLFLRRSDAGLAGSPVEQAAR